MRNIHSIDTISLDNLSNVTGGCGHCHHHCGGGCRGGNTTIINNNGGGYSAPAPAAAASAGFDVQVATGGAAAQAISA